MEYFNQATQKKLSANLTNTNRGGEQQSKIKTNLFPLYDLQLDYKDNLWENYYYLNLHDFDPLNLWKILSVV